MVPFFVTFCEALRQAQCDTVHCYAFSLKEHLLFNKKSQSTTQLSP